MDSRQINFLRNSAFFLLIGIVIFSLGCSTTEKATDDQGITTDRDTAAISKENMTELQQMLAENRSKLSDLYTSQKHDMPTAFMKKDSSTEAINNDPYDGYRVQIISTRNIQLADSVANQYRSWADSTIKGYSAEAYTFFRQPFYKVHIGDFQQRKQANSFSKLIKQKYPDAWVVHDRINPSNVPADTASFSIIKTDTTGTKPQ